MGRREDTELDRELAVLPPELRWREWMRRIEAVLFASTTPVAREDLARVVGQGAEIGRMGWPWAYRGLAVVALA